MAQRDGHDDGEDGLRGGKTLAAGVGVRAQGRDAVQLHCRCVCDAMRDDQRACHSGRRMRDAVRRDERSAEVVDEAIEGG